MKLLPALTILVGAAGSLVYDGVGSQGYIDIGEVVYTLFDWPVLDLLTGIFQESFCFAHI